MPGRKPPGKWARARLHAPQLRPVAPALAALTVNNLALPSELHLELIEYNVRALAHGRACVALDLLDFRDGKEATWHVNLDVHEQGSEALFGPHSQVALLPVVAPLVPHGGALGRSLSGSTCASCGRSRRTRVCGEASSAGSTCRHFRSCVLGLFRLLGLGQRHAVRHSFGQSVRLELLQPRNLGSASSCSRLCSLSNRALGSTPLLQSRTDRGARGGGRGS